MDIANFILPVYPIYISLWSTVYSYSHSYSYNENSPLMQHHIIHHSHKMHAFKPKNFWQFFFILSFHFVWSSTVLTVLTSLPPCLLSVCLSLFLSALHSALYRVCKSLHAPIRRYFHPNIMAPLSLALHVHRYAGAALCYPLRIHPKSLHIHTINIHTRPFLYFPSRWLHISHPSIRTILPTHPIRTNEEGKG